MRQSYGTEKPKETWLEVLHKAQGAPCVVHFNEDIQEETVTDADGDSQTEYTAEHHMLKTAYREGLEAAVKENRGAWLTAAIKTEETGEAKTETEVLQEAVETLKEANASLENAVNDLTVAVLEGGN